MCLMNSTLLVEFKQQISMVKKRLKALGSLKSNATKIQLWRQHLVQPPLTQKQVGVDATMGVFLTQQSNQRDVSIPKKTA
jgi:hypothetical protein